VVTGTIIGIAGGYAYGIGVEDATGIYPGDTVRFAGTLSQYTVASVTGTLVNLTNFFDVGYANIGDTITFIGNQFDRAKIMTMSDRAVSDEYGTLSTSSVYNLKGSVYANEHGLQVTYADPDGVNTNTFQVNVSTTITNTNSNDLITIDIANQWLPAGSIIMWTKLKYKIPYGWWLCDGTTTPNGMMTPDLRDRFVVGADSDINGVPTVTDRTNAQITSGGTSTGVLLSHGHIGTGTTYATYDPGHDHLAVGPNTVPNNMPDPANDLKGPYDPSPQIKTFWGFTTESSPIAVQWMTGPEHIVDAVWGNVSAADSGIAFETRVTVQSTGTNSGYSNLPQYKSLYYIFKWLTPATADLRTVYALPPARGTLQKYFCVQTTKWGTYADGLGGTYDQVMEVNSRDCGYVPPTPRGTLISTSCRGYDKWGTYADGAYGTYDALIQTNSTECDYIGSVQAGLLLIGSGGGGGNDAGGGGGGGGSSYGTITLTVGSQYTVTVSAGGAGGGRGSPGGDTAVSGFSLIAHGGGGGGTVYEGGGAGGTASGGTNNATGGAGGAGARAGCNSGSPGTASGSATSAGGGGGEIDYNDGTPTPGGAGGGGYAGAGGNGAGWDQGNNTNGGSYGGGGGGGKNYGGAGASGAGGVAVIIYTASRRLFNGGTVSSSGSGAATVWTHLFASSGTLG
jgi:hypothetical protein